MYLRPTTMSGAGGNNNWGPRAMTGSGYDGTGHTRNETTKRKTAYTLGHKGEVQNVCIVVYLLHGMECQFLSRHHQPVSPMSSVSQQCLSALYMCDSQRIRFADILLLL